MDNEQLFALKELPQIENVQEDNQCLTSFQEIFFFIYLIIFAVHWLMADLGHVQG